MSAQEPVFAFPSPASLDALAEHLFDGSNTVRPLPRSHMPLSILDRATQPPKEAPVSPSTRHAIRLDHPHWRRPPSACRATADHRSRRMVKAYQINMSGLSRSNLSHHRRSAQSMVVGVTTTSMRMLGGPMLLDLTRGSQRHKLILSSSKSNLSCSSSVRRLLHKCKSSPCSPNSVF